MKGLLFWMLLVFATLLAAAGGNPATPVAEPAQKRGAADPRIKQVRGLSEENKKLKDELQALRDQLASQSQASLQQRLELARLETERAAADKAAAEAERVASIERAAAAAAALKQSEVELQAAQLNASATSELLKSRHEQLALELRIAEAEVKKATEESKKAQSGLEALAAEERIARLQLEQSKEARLTQQAAVRLAEINETTTRLRLEEESAVHREGLRKGTLQELAATDHKQLKGVVSEAVRGLSAAFAKHANATVAALGTGQGSLAEALASLGNTLAPALVSAVEAHSKASGEALELQLQHSEALAERHAAAQEALAARADTRVEALVGAAANQSAALAEATAAQAEALLARSLEQAEELATRSEAAALAVLAEASERLAVLMEAALNKTEAGAGDRAAAGQAALARLAVAVEGLVPALTTYLDGVLARREKTDAELARMQAEVDAAARIRSVRENEDVHARAAAAEAAATRERWMATLDAASSKVAAGFAALLSPAYGLPLLAGVVGAGAGLAAAREAFGLVREALRRRMGRPSLLRVLKTRSPALEALAFAARVLLAVATAGLSLLLPWCLVKLGCRRHPSAVPADPWADVLLDEELAKSVRRLATSTQTARENAAPLRNVLLYGAAGTGKTLCAERLAAVCGLDFGIMSGADVAPLGADAVTELNRLFKWAKARRASGSRGFLLLIDEAESFLMNRTAAAAGTASASETLKHCLAAFLHHTGTTSDSLMLVLCTNRPGDIDSAVIDRLDEQLCFGLPDLPLRTRLLRHYVGRYIVSRSQFRDLSPEAAAAAVLMPRQRSATAGDWTTKPKAVKAVAARLAAGSAPARCCWCASVPAGGPTIFLAPDACDPALWTGLAARCPGLSGRGINKLAATLQATAYAEGLKPVPAFPGVASPSPPALGFVLDAATVLDVFAGEMRKTARQAAARTVLTPRLIGPHLGASGASSTGSQGGSAGGGGLGLDASSTLGVGGGGAGSSRAVSATAAASASTLGSPLPRAALFVDTSAGAGGLDVHGESEDAPLEEDPEFSVPQLRVPDAIASGAGKGQQQQLRHRKK